MLEWIMYQHRVFKSSQGECECLKAEQLLETEKGN